MQLFAITTKQEGSVSVEQRQLVEGFLLQQLDREAARDYLALYDDLSGYNKPQQTESAPKGRRLTSVKDSVRTLSICSKINKTLTQKQKIVLLIRLLELISADEKVTPLEKEIVDTVSLVFKFEPNEYKIIEQFVFKSMLDEVDMDELLIVNQFPDGKYTKTKHIPVESLDGSFYIIHAPSVDMYFLKYTGDEEVFLNGLTVNKKHIYLFSYGSTIKLPKGKPIYYSDVVSRFLKDKTESRLSFCADDLIYRFKGGNLGLNHVNINEENGFLIAIMGASGAGKTTLLNVLSGIEKPTSGSVRINKIDIFSEKEKVEGVIGYVAQDDLLMEELTVYQNLYYNAKLCFKNLKEKELDALVLKTLVDLGLGEIKGLKVGSVLDKKISGGQRKRLNIALELIREPAVLFLDEPTSGLSSRDSENIMDLLKELASKGKLIFVVIHQPSSDIYKMFDKILILDVGGKPIYYGNPVEAVMYFKKADKQLQSEKGQCSECGNVNTELIFNIIEAKVVDEYGKLTEKRKVSPEHWYQLFQKNFPAKQLNEVNDAPPRTLRIPSLFNQLKIFIIRDVLSKISNTQYMLINFLEAPVLALILAFIIRYVEDPLSDVYKFSDNDNIVAYLFMCIIVALFMGLTVSAEEIIRDRKIQKREKFLNLSRLGYLWSKVIILFVISSIQTLSFTLIGNYILEIRDMNIGYWFTLFSVSCFANMLGMNISASFNSAVTIYILIPILLIPQMILSGAIFSFDKLNQFVGKRDKVPIIADLMASRWAFEGLMVHQFKDNLFERNFYELEKKESQFDFKQVYLIPELKDRLKTTEMYWQSPYDSLKQKALRNLQVVRNEIENESRITSMPFTLSDRLSPDHFNSKIADSARSYLDELGDYYTNHFSEVNTRKEMILSNAQSTPPKAQVFKFMKSNYFNNDLEDIVTNKTAEYRLVEVNGRMVQLIDAVYLDPIDRSNPLAYRAHFYAPNKHLFGNLFDTFFFNVLVIWFMTTILFFTLYFESLKYAMDSMEKLFSGVLKLKRWRVSIRKIINRK
ncbi:MAG: ABC transporter [Bacteroidetes bacterium RIFCSPLOWO2_02_FULL_36_8]|nr:MAG: ABC transporter [Bacteroidetes bacterium RIFCSPLOWO2_02_FULL_36_8]OFY69230.1 MAG: ABC transporter [Bacteroidetes bacterium RIFCSPLOWO2_12_FULL_37_12]